MHIASNQCYNGFSDWFFSHITHLGDGLFVAIFGLVLALYSIRASLLVMVSYLVSGIFVQIFKRALFSGSPRPKMFFEGWYDLRFVPGVDVHMSNSFPSGHTVTAFAFFLALSFILKNKWLQMLCIVFAIITAYSRVYLSQHFLIDITVGSIIGVLTTFVYYALQQKLNPWWFNIPVWKLVKK